MTGGGDSMGVTLLHYFGIGHLYDDVGLRELLIESDVFAKFRSV